MEAPKKRAEMDWTDQPNYPRPDYLSSSRKRLAPQLMFKGGILNSWGKKSAVALSKAFFDTLPKLATVPKHEASIAWFIYDLVHNDSTGRYELTKVDEVFTQFNETLVQITTTKAGPLDKFLKQLQDKLDEQLETAPVNKLIDNPI